MIGIGKRVLSKAKRVLAHRLVQRPASFTLDRPIVTFTFDDFPVSALDNGGRVLESEGFRGTYYAAFGLAETETSVGRVGTAKHMASCVERGHELACHTYAHIDCADATLEVLERERERNEEAAESVKVPRMRNFAYPYGSFGPNSKRWASSHFDTVRTVLEGVNRGDFDMASLRATAIYASSGVDPCFRSLSELPDNPGWLIFYTHDVSEVPSDYGCTVDEFTGLVALCSQLSIDVLKVSEAAKRIRHGPNN